MSSILINCESEHFAVRIPEEAENSCDQIVVSLGYFSVCAGENINNNKNIVSSFSSINNNNHYNTNNSCDLDYCYYDYLCAGESKEEILRSLNLEFHSTEHENAHHSNTGNREDFHSRNFDQFEKVRWGWIRTEPGPD